MLRCGVVCFAFALRHCFALLVLFFWLLVCFIHPMCLSFEAATIPEDLEPLLQRLPEGSDQEASCRKAVKAALHYLPFQALSNLQSRLRAASKDQDELEAVGRSLCEVLTYG